MRVSLSESNRSFSVAPDESILDAAINAGLKLPHSCKSGNCGACRARLLRGEASYPNGRPLSLSETEIAEGVVLLCQARAHGDLSIEVIEVSTPDHALIKRLPCRVDSLQRWGHDVMGIFLRLPAAERFDFQAGQYIDVMLPGSRRRSFSIASPPHDSRLLELHVRRVEGGEFTERMFAEDARGTLLTIEGPLGHIVYRARTDQATMLLIGGGTGLAPLKSILRHVIEKGVNREMILYWGVRGERDLYAHDTLEAIARRAANFRYIPVLSEPTPAWRGRRGWVHEAVLADAPHLERYDIYASGPPAMIEAVQRDFGPHGAAPARLSCDSFDYAPDSLVRHRMMAATKS